jgi:hypothetical protein
MLIVTRGPTRVHSTSAAADGGLTCDIPDVVVPHT